MEKRIDSTRSLTRTLSPFFHLGFDAIHYDFAREKKAVQFCRIERFKSGWRATHGGLYDGLFYPIVKALEARKSELRRTQGRATDAWRYFWFIIPVVVLSGDIYSIDSMQSVREVEAVDFMRFKRQLMSKKLKGTYGVEFVHQACVEGFVENVRAAYRLEAQSAYGERSRVRLPGNPTLDRRRPLGFEKLRPGR